MPTIAEHLQMSEKDLKFARSLEMTDYLEWEIVGYFYAILHKTQAYLHLNDVSDSELAGHSSMKEYVREYLPELAADYAALLSASHTARYKEPYRITAEFLTMSKDLYRSLNSGLTRRISSIRAERNSENSATQRTTVF